MKVVRITTPAALAAALLLALWTPPLLALEIKARVLEASGATVKITRDARNDPRVGDRVDILFAVPGTDTFGQVATGKVTEIAAEHIVVQIEKASGKVGKGDLASVLSDRPVPRVSIPPKEPVTKEPVTKEPLPKTQPGTDPIEPTPRPRPNGRLLFKDRFDTPEPLTDPVFNPEIMAFDNVDGRGRLSTSFAGVAGVVYSKQQAGDFAAEYEFRAPDPPPNSSYGFVFRSEREPTGALPNYYLLLVHPRKQKVFLNRWQREWSPVKDYTLEAGQVAVKGNNKVRLEAVGAQFRIFLNGTFLGEASDDKIKGPGIFGLFVSADKEEKNTVYFGNLRVYELPPEEAPATEPPPKEPD